MSEQKHTEGTVQTTGHAWDGDIQEFNNPLPRWWIWAFYASVLFAIGYWIIYPSWPVGFTEKGYLTGVGNTITFKNDKGEDVTTHWNTRALLLEDMQTGAEAVKQREYLQKVAAASYSEIAADADMMAFTNSYAKGLFGDNCAACHQAGGAGVIGKYPNLADDGWLYGGNYASIEHSIKAGRKGNMPAFAQLEEKQKDDLAEYVLSLSGHQVDRTKAARGGQQFSSSCVACHGANAKGNTALGAANLTDRIWTMADVPGAADLESKKTAIKQVIDKGISRHMPAWSGRLSNDEIKLLTVYVHSLGGGQ